MLTLSPNTPAHVVAFVLDGTATAPDVRALYRAIEAAAAAGHVHLCGEIAGVGGMTLDAVGTNLARGVRLLARLGQIDRYATAALAWAAEPIEAA